MDISNNLSYCSGIGQSVKIDLCLFWLYIKVRRKSGKNAYCKFVWIHLIVNFDGIQTTFVLISQLLFFIFVLLDVKTGYIQQVLVKLLKASHSVQCLCLSTELLWPVLSFYWDEICPRQTDRQTDVTLALFLKYLSLLIRNAMFQRHLYFCFHICQVNSSEVVKHQIYTRHIKYITRMWSKGKNNQLLSVEVFYQI